MGVKQLSHELYDSRVADHPDRESGVARKIRHTHRTAGRSEFTSKSSEDLAGWSEIREDHRPFALADSFPLPDGAHVVTDQLVSHAV